MTIFTPHPVFAGKVAVIAAAADNDKHVECGRKTVSEDHHRVHRITNSKYGKSPLILIPLVQISQESEF